MAGDPIWKSPRPLRDPKPLRRKQWGVKTSKRKQRKNEAKYLAAQEQRDLAYARAGWRCEVCSAGSFAGLHCHHMRRRSQGGSDAASNLLVVCSACHSYIHDNPAWARERGFLK